jgi:hypothetical protein
VIDQAVRLSEVAGELGMSDEQVLAALDELGATPDQDWRGRPLVRAEDARKLREKVRAEEAERIGRQMAMEAASRTYGARVREVYEQALAEAREEQRRKMIEAIKARVEGDDRFTSMTSTGSRSRWRPSRWTRYTSSGLRKRLGAPRTSGSHGTRCRTSTDGRHHSRPTHRGAPSAGNRARQYAQPRRGGADAQIRASSDPAWEGRENQLHLGRRLGIVPPVRGRPRATTRRQGEARRGSLTEDVGGSGDLASPSHKGDGRGRVLRSIGRLPHNLGKE